MTRDPSQTYQVSAQTKVRMVTSNSTATPLRSDGVLADEEAQPVGPFTDFVAADTPFKMELDQPTSGEDAETTVAVVDHTIDRDEASDFGFVLLHEVHTPDGVVYEVTLPVEPTQGVLSDEDELPAKTLRFPVKRFMEAAPQQGAQPGASGVLGDDDDSFIGSTFEHIVRIVKAPITGAIDTLVARNEPQPTPLRVADDGSLQPLGDAMAWRNLFDKSDREQRVLLFMHGFMSSSEVSFPRAWLPWLRQEYDAVVAYTHPTMSRSPLTNVTDLLERIPPDLRLRVDVVAHSRGGLVARSLVELATQVPQVTVTKLLTCGTPHSGTPLARPEQWDKLASIIFTATSWMLTAAGAPFTAKLLPKLVEQILKAGSKHFFALAGVNALVPDNPFLQQLNTINVPPIMESNLYAAVVSSFQTDSIVQAGFKQALAGLVAGAFINAPNDLIIPTDSMNAIDALNAPFGGKQHAAKVNHFGYFDDNGVEQFARSFLVDG